jgi:hypothetical protein
MGTDAASMSSEMSKGIIPRSISQILNSMGDEKVKVSF